MTKKNKMRYKSDGNTFPNITLTGKVSLRHIEDEITPQKGDLQVYLSTDSLVYNEQIGDYESIGLDGYLKAVVHDGKGWKPISIEEFFPDREYYFGKRERPIDTYNMCLPTFQQLQGVVLSRTYREHYRVAAPGDSKI